MQRAADFSLPKWAAQFGSRVFRETHHPSGQLAQLLTAIRMEKRSGVLEVNFNQGSPAGTIKFTESQKE